MQYHLEQHSNTFYITYKNNKYILDKCDWLRLLNFDRNIYPNETLTQKNTYSFVDFILNKNTFIKSTIEYKNGNTNDLRKDNIIIKSADMQLKFNVNNDNTIGFIQYFDNKLILDIHDFIKVINSDKKFIYNDKSQIYPYYKYNKRHINIIEYIKDYYINNLSLLFINDNKYDLCKSNITAYHKYNKIMINKYSDAYYIAGHYNKKGKDAYIMKNPMWKVKDIYYVYCDGDKLFTIDDKSLDILTTYEDTHNIKLTYFVHSNGYVMCNPKKLYIHQIIMGCYGNGKGTKKVSVDHIDQDPLNNRYENLRIADRKTQEKTSKGIKKGTKRARKKTAKPLPEGITQDMLPKYVVYYKECVNKEKQIFREFFKIEKHAKIEKPIMSSKARNKPILEKLEEIKQKLKILNSEETT
jgi:hypothetical protein